VKAGGLHALAGSEVLSVTEETCSISYGTVAGALSKK
jgi:hypothetical protein